MMGALARCAGVIGGLALLLATAPLHAGEQTIKDMPSDHVDADKVDFPTLCTHEDWVVFNAVSDVDAKLVSVCLSEGDDSYPSHLTFRYGTSEKVEFSYPEKAEGSFDAFLLRRYTRPQTTYLKFEMTRDGRTYAVLAGGEGDAYSASLRVTREGEGDIVLDHDLIVMTAPYGLMALEDSVPMAPFDE